MLNEITFFPSIGKIVIWSNNDTRETFRESWVSMLLFYILMS